MPTLRARKQTEYVVSDDDLDELEGDEEEEVKPNVGPLDGCLSMPRHQTMNTKQLHDYIHTGTVDLNPEYQRDVVWPEARMLGLIQSLFLNYYVPPLIFAVTKDSTGYGADRRVAIDGKQRCTTILRFMDGEIPFVSPATKEKFWYRNINGRGKILPKGLKDKFDLTTISVVEYDGVSDQTQRDIFQRVQMGVPLSAAEKLQAVPGPWTKWISELYKKYVQEPGTLADTIHWDTSRGRPFQALASIVILAWDETREKAITAVEINRFLMRTDGPEARFRKKIETTMAIFVNLATDYQEEAFGTVQSSRVAPVEMWFSALIIYKRMSTTPLRQLAKHIGDMRSHVRKTEVDIRTNSRVVGRFFKYLQSMPQYKLKPGEKPAIAEFDGEDLESDEEPLAKKRKREAAQEDADPDFRGPAVARYSRSDVVGNTRLQQQQQQQQQPQASSSQASAPRQQAPPSALAAAQSSSSARRVIDYPGRPQVQTSRPAPSPMDVRPSQHAPQGYGQNAPAPYPMPHTQPYHNQTQRPMSPGEMAAYQHHHNQQQQYMAMMRAQQQHQMSQANQGYRQ